MRKLSVGDCISFGWETFKKRPWFLIGTLLLVLIITSIPGSFGPDLPDIDPDGEFIPEPVTAISLIALLASIIVSTLAACGIVTFYLRAHDNVMAYSSPISGIPARSGAFLARTSSPASPSPWGSWPSSCPALSSGSD